jgi:ABC-type sugar transport system substrate-binding protein
MKVHTTKISLGFLCPIFLAIAQSPAFAEGQQAFTLSKDIQAHVAKAEKPVIRVSYHDVSNEFAPFIKKGVEKAAAEFNVDAQLVGPVGADAEKQVAEIESLIQKGVDGLAVSSVSTDALAPIIQRALAQGIPVVTFNTDNPSSHRLAFAGQDLVESGRIAGKLLADTLSGKGNVIITTLDAAAQWSLDREKGAGGPWQISRNQDTDHGHHGDRAPANLQLRRKRDAGKQGRRRHSFPGMLLHPRGGRLHRTE